MKLINSEKLALKKIYEMTLEAGKRNRFISNEDFIQDGLYRRDTLVIKATKGLHEKGLIFRVKNCPHSWRYQLSIAGKNQAVLLLVEVENVG